MSLRPSAFPFAQQDIDHVLRLGGNNANSRNRAAAEFMKQQPLEDISGFLSREYVGGGGFTDGGKRFSAWYSEDGIHLAQGDSARYVSFAQLVPWAEAAARIGELLEQGQFATNVELAETKGYIRSQLARSLWYIRRDIDETAREQHYLSSMEPLDKGGYPEMTERLADALAEPEFLTRLTAEYRQFLAACHQDRSILRFHYHHADEMLSSLQELARPWREYSSHMTEPPKTDRFITEDEINAALTRGSSVEGGKGRIYSYFAKRHTPKEQADFLKREYGIGGHNNALPGSFSSDESHDGKGIRLRKQGCADILLTWPKVASRITELMRRDRYLTPKEKERFAALQKPNEPNEPVATGFPSYADYEAVKAQHPDDVVLYQVGDFFEMYGKDADIASVVLGVELTSRAVDGARRVPVCGVPSHNLELYVEQLRDKYDVTISGIEVTSGKQRVYTLLSVDHKAERAIDAHEEEYGADGIKTFPGNADEATQRHVYVKSVEQYIPSVAAAIEADDAYRNACHNSDRENAYIEGDAAVQRAVLSSGDIELIRLYSDVPEFHTRLVTAVLDTTYPKLHDSLRPISQEDTDQAQPTLNEEVDAAAVRQSMTSPEAQEQAAAMPTAEHIPYPEQRQQTDEYPDENPDERTDKDLNDDPDENLSEWAESVERDYRAAIAELPEEQRRVVKAMEAMGLQLKLNDQSWMDNEAVVFTPVDLEHGYPSTFSSWEEAFQWLDEAPFDKAPGLRDTVQAILHPQEPYRFPFAVGDTVYLEGGKAFVVEEVSDMHIQLRDPTLIYPIWRSESRESFARLMQNYPQPGQEQPTQEQPTQAQPSRMTSETVAVYPAEENNLPYDIVIQTLHTEPEHTPPHTPLESDPPPENFRITDDNLGVGDQRRAGNGAKSKFRANMDAIATLQQIESDGRSATPEEQEVLAKYVGWGGIPDAFDESKPNWSSEFKELQAALTPDEYAAARASTLNAHYTSPTVIRAIYDAVGNMGFKSGNILEPSMGVGNFFGCLPESMATSRLYGVELDSITGRIAQQLYPQADITIAGFETTDRRDFYDLAIGNVPFGQYSVNEGLSQNGQRELFWGCPFSM